MSVPADLDQWRKAARIAAEARELGATLAAPGTRLEELADSIEAYIRSKGAEPAFPANLSRNTEAAHYTPSPKDPVRLEPGDLLKIDVGAHIEGAIADTALTVEVGGGQRHTCLRRAVDEAIEAGISRIAAGVDVDEIGQAIEAAAHRHGFLPIRDLSGHAIRPYLLHAGKSIPNAGGLSHAKLEEGEIIAVEPFVTNGEGRIENGPFGNILRFREEPKTDDAVLARLFGRFRTLPFTLRWVEDPKDRETLRRSRRLLQTYPVFVERGGGLVAQREHTLLVTATGVERLTGLDD